MNILILNWRDPKNPLSGGAEIVTLEHAKTWVKVGHSVTWFTSMFTGGKKSEKIEGVTIIRHGSALGVYLFAFFFYLFSKKKFDVVIDEIHGFPFFTPLYVWNSKKIAFIHEVAGIIWDYMYPFPINKLGKFLESFYFLLYKKVKFWTDAQSTIEELVAKGIPRENCISIACPVSNVVLSHVPEKEKDPTFIFVSRLVKMKGIESILEAFVLIFQKESKAKLWIVGGGEVSYVKYLKSKIKNLEYTYRAKNLSSNIHFYGKVTDEKKLKLMQRAHILLHASVKEGWGLVVVEAASQGTPSIVYNVAGLRDSVKNKLTGIVLEKNSPEKMAESAIALYKNKKEYIMYVKNGLNLAKNITWETATDESLLLLTA
jgi:glycosyltransferase involved in cell wall biosynthesis